MVIGFDTLFFYIYPVIKCYIYICIYIYICVHISFISFIYLFIYLLDPSLDYFENRSCAFSALAQQDTHVRSAGQRKMSDRG